MIEDDFDLTGKSIFSCRPLALADEDQVPDDEEGVIDKAERCGQSQQVSTLQLLNCCDAEHITDKKRQNEFNDG